MQGGTWSSFRTRAVGYSLIQPGDPDGRKKLRRVLWVVGDLLEHIDEGWDCRGLVRNELHVEDRCALLRLGVDVGFEVPN